MDAAINGDLGVRAVVDTTTMAWSPSPSASVWRKRVHRVGPAESGQVTSVVRYDPGSRFPAHDHPDGEEIFVLEGVFSDEHGDWPAGTYLLNPEGFHHAPFSDRGCVLFVKLRQFAGRGRKHVVIDTNRMDYVRGTGPGIATKLLYEQHGFADRVTIERWDAATARGTVCYPHGAELFVLDGEFSDEAGSYIAGCWMRFPIGFQHKPRSARGCTMYVKRSGLVYLASAATA